MALPLRAPVTGALLPQRSACTGGRAHSASADALTGRQAACGSRPLDAAPAPAGSRLSACGCGTTRPDGALAARRLRALGAHPRGASSSSADGATGAGTGGADDLSFGLPPGFGRGVSPDSLPTQGRSVVEGPKGVALADRDGPPLDLDLLSARARAVPTARAAFGSRPRRPAAGPRTTRVLRAPRRSWSLSSRAARATRGSSARATWASGSRPRCLLDPSEGARLAAARGSERPGTGLLGSAPLTYRRRRTRSHQQLIEILSYAMVLTARAPAPHCGSRRAKAHPSDRLPAHPFAFADSLLSCHQLPRSLSRPAPATLRRTTTFSRRAPRAPTPP